MNGKQDAERFAQAMAGVGEVYGRELSAAAMKLWWELLAPYDIDSVERALRDCMRSPDSGQFAPKPADVIKAIDGSIGDRALQAWGKVMDAMRHVGRYESVAFDDSAIHSVITDMGGWPNLCSTKLEELPFLQKRFCDLYRAVKPGSIAIGYLPGEAESSNALRGHETRPPVLVGDVAAAKRLADLGRGGKTIISSMISSAVKRLQ